MNLNLKYNEKLSPLEKELSKVPKIFTGSILHQKNQLFT